MHYILPVCLNSIASMFVGKSIVLENTKEISERNKAYREKAKAKKDKANKEIEESELKNASLKERIDK